MAFNKPGLYDPKQVTISVAGIQLYGLAEDNFVELEREVDTFMKTVGADGEVARSRSGNKSGTLTVRLMQTSSCNDKLSVMANNDELTGTGFGAMTVKDNLPGNTTLASGQNAWIRKIPNVTFSKGIEIREWVFDIDNVSIFVGGSA